MSLMAAPDLAGHPEWVSSKHPDGKNAPQAKRARQLVEAMEAESSAAFALWLGVDPRRWNNFEVGHPFSLDIAKLLMVKIKGLSFDWIFDGNPNGLSVEMARKLGELPDAAATKQPAKAKTPQRRPQPRRGAVAN